jgi:tetratricopeptide (TPR) repeat protein
MEENIPGEIAETSTQKGCINCGNLWVVPGYPNPLCQDCRDELTSFRVPNWVKLFAAGIGIILLFSLYKIPRNILTGIQFEKGKTAMAEKKYLTAQQEFQKVVDKAPGYIEAQSYLLITSFHNLDFITMSKTFEVLKDKTIEDQGLFKQLENTLEKAGSYYNNDEVKRLEQEYGDDFTKIPDTALKRFLTANNNTYAAMGYGARLFERDEFAACDTIMKAVISNDPGFSPAYMTLASSKRQQNQFEESIRYCDQVLSMNSEYLEAIASKSRTLLKSNKDKEALELALASFKMDEKNLYATGSLILVYHFTKKAKEEKELLSKVSQLTDSASVESLKYVMDVISGKEFFRN